MNIEDSRRLFFSKVALLNSMLPVHFVDGRRGKKDSEQLRFCLGEAPSILESEGASFLLATCPSSQRQFLYPFIIAPLPIFNMRFLSILRSYYGLQATFARKK